ncbi:MAG: glycosyltransferase, partial [Lachnospiraceae bacterium]|nr:glycosyltransferase [Lachnospiraceae bacterium]
AVQKRKRIRASDGSSARLFGARKEQLTGSRIKNFRIRFGTLRNIWKIYKPDVILSFLGKNNFMAIATAAFLPAKVAVSVRGEPTMEYEGGLMRFLAKHMFVFADGVILQTQRAKEFFPKAVQKKSVILKNPLNPAFLGRNINMQRDNVIVAAGRLDENKNHAMLIHAFAKIAGEYPEMRLAIYGDGPLREELLALVREKNLEERVTLPGNIDNVAEMVGRAKIFTLTSNTEGMPNSIIEAMVLGTPVIATDCPCGGPATLIKDGENGMLVPVGDAYALADAMRKILSDEAFAQKLSENAVKLADELAPEKVDREWENYLFEIL